MNDKSILNFGIRLKEEIKEKYGKANKFAIETNIYPQTISGYVNGRRSPNGITLAIFANAGLDIAYIITGTKLGINKNITEEKK